ncbi:MAG: hypothetical protein V8T86_12625 [Victivallis sp.]
MSETSIPGCPSASSLVMASRSANGARLPPDLCGGSKAGTKSTLAVFPEASACFAMPRWPRWGGSKLPP